jgi:hypothetical protein
MTLAISTSSPVANAALFSEQGELLLRQAADPGAPAPIGALVSNLLGDARPARVAVDVGPGGFAATRAGVAFAKALSWALGLPLAPLSAFDLVDRASTVAFPASKGRWHVRVPSDRPSVADVPPPGAVGYGPDFQEPCYPDASRAGPLLAAAVWSDPAAVLPDYQAQPSISAPRRPFRA